MWGGRGATARPREAELSPVFFFGGGVVCYTKQKQEKNKISNDDYDAAVLNDVSVSLVSLEG